MRVYTIGFTKKTAEAFFAALCDSGAKRVVDVRLNNVSQLSGFSKRDDLRYFLQVICGIDFVHLPELAPSAELLDAYRKHRMQWNEYVPAYLGLIRARRVEETVPRELIDDGCLLCSEDKPDRCHRRLVAQYLDQAWGGLDIVHLG